MATRGWENVTLSDVTSRVLKHSKPAKMRNVRTRIATGEMFDSKAEAEWWLGLVARQAAGEISALRRQVPFALYAPVLGKNGEWNTGILQSVSDYVADAVYIENGVEVVADRKGNPKRTQMFCLKRKWLLLQQGIVILEI